MRRTLYTAPEVGTRVGSPGPRLVVATVLPLATLVVRNDVGRRWFETMRCVALVAVAFALAACPSPSGMDAASDASTMCSFLTGTNDGVVCRYDYTCSDGTRPSVACNGTECVCLSASGAPGTTFDIADFCSMAIEPMTALVLSYCSGDGGTDGGSIDAAFDASSPDASRDATVAVGTCETVCNRQAQAMCPNFDIAQCVLACRSSMNNAGPGCADAFQRYLTCLSNASFGCSSMGIPSTMACTAETNALFDCM